MNSLKCVTETIHKVDFRDLEKFILEQTGYSYDIVPNEEWGNDEQHRFEINGQIDEWDIKDWNAFKNSGTTRMYHTKTFMNGLCADGKLDAGTYLITVSW